MSAIDTRNETGIRLEDLSRLFRLANKAEKSLKLPDVTRRFFLVAGIPITPAIPHQPYTSRDEIIAAQQESARLLLSVVKVVQRNGIKPKPLPEWVEAENIRLSKAKTGSSKARIKSRRRVLTEEQELHKYGISCKTPQSMDRKARDKYQGDYSRISDPVRVTLYAQNLPAIRSMANHFRPCNNPSVVEFEDSFSCKDDEKGIRRLMIKYKLANGCIGEIQVLDGRAEAAYKKSHEKYGIERAVGNATRKTFDTQMQKRLGLLQSHAHHERVALNEDVNERLGLNGLVLRRDFFTVNGFPVMHVYDPFTTETYAVVPNPITSLYEIDNRFAVVIENDADKKFKVEPSTRAAFIQRSNVLIHSEATKAVIIEGINFN